MKIKKLKKFAINAILLKAYPLSSAISMSKLTQKNESFVINCIGDFMRKISAIICYNEVVRRFK